jgi:TM2 domain-containing membrane protein YozV
MISSLLVFQYGQTRIWFAMSRDGLLPRFFSTLHTRFKTPHWSTWIAGFLVGIPAGIVDIGQAADLSNIGTLFAFVLVSLGVIFLRRSQPDRKRSFRVPFVPLFPIISFLLCVSLMAGLLVVTWLRFFFWLVLGLVFFFSWGRYWSEFSDAGFRSLIEEENQKKAAMDPSQLRLYQSARKNHGLAWLLCFFLGPAGAHRYYLGERPFGAAFTVLLAITVSLIVLSQRLHNGWMGYFGYGLAGVLVVMSLLDLLRVVRRTQEFNLQAARRAEALAV